MPWDTETTEKLKKLWAEGHTASQISKMLGGGISRNAVIGKAHRLSLGGRTQSRMISSPKINNFNNQNKIQGQKRIRRPRGLRAIVIEKDFEAEKPTTLENLTDKTCRWPIGHPWKIGFIANYMFYMLINLKALRVMKTKVQRNYPILLRRK